MGVSVAEENLLEEPDGWRQIVHMTDSSNSSRLAGGLFRTHCEAETREVAAGFARRLLPDTTIALVGELGVGKTAFVKGLADGFGVEQTVTSPSFAICNFYRGRRLLVHADAYRLKRCDEWEALMLDDFLVSPWCLAVEWPERIPPDWLVGAWRVCLEVLESDCREIRIEPPE